MQVYTNLVQLPVKNWLHFQLGISLETWVSSLLNIGDCFGFRSVKTGSVVSHGTMGSSCTDHGTSFLCSSSSTWFKWRCHGYCWQEGDLWGISLVAYTWNDPEYCLMYLSYSCFWICCCVECHPKHCQPLTPKILTGYGIMALCNKTFLSVNIAYGWHLLKE